REVAHDAALAVVAQLPEHLVADRPAADDDAQAAVVAAPSFEQQALELVERLCHGLSAVRDVAREQAAVVLRVELVIALGAAEARRHLLEIETRRRHAHAAVKAYPFGHRPSVASAQRRR